MRPGRIAWPGGEPPDDAAAHERLVAEGFSPFQWSDAPGATYAPHAHPHDESLWVLAGRIDFVIDGETHRLGPGDRLYLPANTVHAAEAGPQGATYLIGQRLG
jgi:quercetin dioxygenase-like cupin family protein